MKFRLVFDCDNASFGNSEDELRLAVQEAVRAVMTQIPKVGDITPVRDMNGNTIGVAEFYNKRITRK